MTNGFTDEDVLDRSPYLCSLKRKRLAPSRLAELLTAAKGSNRPSEPPLGECCGSSCKPCVTELWRQELRCWMEVHPDGVDGEEEEEEAETEAREDGGEKGKARPVVGGGGRAKDLGTPTIEIKLELRKEGEGDGGPGKGLEASGLEF